MKVTIIIPLRITDGVFQARERLSNIIKNVPKNKFNILVVDYGTPFENSTILEEVKSDSVEVINISTQNEIFSIGHARDLGVQYAKDDVVMFNDIDFFANSDMYESIYNEVAARDLYNNAYDFFCVPVFFLTEQATLEISSNESSAATFNSFCHRKIIESQSGFVEFPAYGSSAIVVNKNHYLGIGGHSREFFGHGAEDYDVLHRLATYYVKGPRTAEYYLNTKSNDIKNYRGFRAFFSLYGIDIFNKGVYFLHLWHPKRIVPGYHQTSRNFSLLESLMKKFDSDRDQPFPLGDLNLKEKTLVLIDSKSKTFKAIRHALPKLGTLEFINENTFYDSQDLVNYVKKNDIDRVLFLNPYGNERRLNFYTTLKNNGIRILVFDRGALPNSWFFDPNGFNFDSSTYSEDNWSRALTTEQNRIIEEYIFRLKNGEETLEFNSPRQTSRYLRELYQIGNRKVLFVPFQRPSDTVTTYFAGPAKSVHEFQEWVSNIAKNLSKSEWVIICKNHPLEKDLAKIDGVIYAEDNNHIHDLIELSDKVLLMNSGVGLISLAFNKPVICASNAFYCHSEMAFNANSYEQAIDLINSSLEISFDKVKQFYWHLTQNVYSFGTTKYKKTKAADGSDRNIALEIIFDYINLGNKKITFGTPPKGVTLDAPLFYSYGGRERIKELLKPKAKIAPPKIAPPPINVISSPQVKKQAEIIILPNEKSNKPVKLKKIKKLFKSPALFFKDALKNRKKTTIKI